MYDILIFSDLCDYLITSAAMIKAEATDSSPVSEIMMISVDVSNEPQEFLSNYQIEGVPKLMLFLPGRLPVSPPYQVVSPNSLKSWVMNQVGPQVRYLANAKEVANFVSDHGVFILGYIPSYDSEGEWVPMLQSLASSGLAWDMGIAYTCEDSVGEILGLENSISDSLSIVESGGSGGQCRTRATYVGSPDDIVSITRIVTMHRFSRSIRLDESSFGELLQLDFPVIVVMDGRLEDEVLDSIRERGILVGHTTTSLPTKFTRRLLEFFRLDQQNNTTQVVLLTPSHVQYHMAGPVTPETILAFAEQYRNGELIPFRRDHPQSPLILTRPTVVLLHTPWCFYCAEWLRKFRTRSTDSGVIFFTIDVSQFDPPPYLGSLRTVPQILLVASEDYVKKYDPSDGAFETWLKMEMAELATAVTHRDSSEL
jgi:hypothetical protein